MASAPERNKSFFWPALVVIVLLAIFFGAIASVIFFSYLGQRQATAAADQIQQGINRLQDMASWQQRVNDRVPRAYVFDLDDCRQDCFYRLSVLTAEGEEIVLEKVFLGNVSVYSLRPKAGSLKISLSADGDSSADSPNLVRLNTPFGRRDFLASFNISGKWQRTNFDAFDGQLPEAYLPRLEAGSSATIKINSSTDSGRPQSIGIYWQKEGSFSQLSVKLFQEDLAEERILHSEVRNFDSYLATLCLDLPSDGQSPYRVLLESQGAAGESAKDISLRVFKEYDCRGDNLSQAIGQVEISTIKK